ncbi:MAG TPA: phosphoglycerate kinase [Candidatus Magasanikbacteria bacterium]|nr:phosphoglycerate kinase [Candidatus Magasanikbacteria bacterium]
MQIKTLKSIKNFKGKRVLVRADFNVPIKNGKIKELYKIEKSLPTINFLINKGAKVILLSHLGRPEGMDKSLSLKPVAKALSETLKKEIKISDFNKIKKNPENYWMEAQNLISKMENGEVLILENVRFVKGEEKNDKVVAKKFAVLGDIFVLDGFAVAHRDAATVTGIAKHLPSVAGLLMEEEISGLERIIKKPKKPFVVVLGGAKMETKIPLLKQFGSSAHYILVGGGIANTYYFAKGAQIGNSLFDKDHKKEALFYGKKKNVIMPLDFIVGTNKGEKCSIVDTDKKFMLKKTEAIFDIGPKTVSHFAQIIKKAKTLVWNGAMGYFEQHPYEYGTYAMARLFAAKSKGPAFGVCGGGETVEVLKKLGLMDDIDLVSTGGGAMLEYLSGKKLPGVKIITKN